MEEYIDELIQAVVEAIQNMFSDVTQNIFESFIGWIYELIFSAIGEFFGYIQNMGAEIFDYSWIEATIQLFSLLGWSLYATGIVVAVFDAAMQYQNGTNAIKATAINVLKGFFACSLAGIVPVRLYQFCISLQTTFAQNLASLFGDSFSISISDMASQALAVFVAVPGTSQGLYMLFMLIALGYCVIKIFFQNLMRGGILLTQIALGSLYMFNIPRGYMDGFKGWMKQVIAICMMAFIQTTLLYLGLMTFSDNMLFGLGIMLSAKEVPRICQQFGLETSFNMGQVVSQAFTNVRIVNAVGHLFKK